MLKTEGEVYFAGNVLAECSVAILIVVRCFGVVEFRECAIAVIVLRYKIHCAAGAVHSVKKRSRTCDEFYSVCILSGEME